MARTPQRHGSGALRARLDQLIDRAASNGRPLTSVVLGRRAGRQLQREMGLDQPPTHYRDLPIRVRADYASYLGVEGPLDSVRPDCGCAACRAGVAHEAACPVHEGICRRCGLPVERPAPTCAAHAGPCICGRPVPTHRPTPTPEGGGATTP